jgi:nucleoside-diphosphate-sugar epimerase
MLEQERYILTGGDGFIGVHTRKLCSGMVVFSRRSGGDVTNYEQVKEALKGAKLVVHMAAALPSQNVKTEDFDKVNVGGTENVLTAAKQQKVETVIFTSSAAVKSPDGNSYALSKTKAENMIVDTKPPVMTAALRIENVYGLEAAIQPGQQILRGSGLPYKFFKTIMEGNNKLSIYPDFFRDYVYVCDVAWAIVEATKVRKDLPQGIVIEVGTSRPVESIELAELYAQRYGVSIEYMKTPAISFPQNSQADIRMLQRYLGEHQFVTIQQGFEEMADYFEGVNEKLKSLYQRQKNPAISINLS